MMGSLGYQISAVALPLINMIVLAYLALTKKFVTRETVEEVRRRLDEQSESVKELNRWMTQVAVKIEAVHATCQARLALRRACGDE